jgi:hypothetical protein
MEPVSLDWLCRVASLGKYLLKCSVDSNEDSVREADSGMASVLFEAWCPVEQELIVVQNSEQ